MAKNLMHPAALPLDQQFDLLVDNELPEAQRKDLLESLDQRPAEWRRLAVRFLERQAERSAVRSFMTQREPRSLFDVTPVKSSGLWGMTRLKAAGLIIVAGLTVALPLMMNHDSNPGSKNSGQSDASLVSLPTKPFGGGDGSVNVSLPAKPAGTRDAQDALAFPSDQGVRDGSSRHLVVMRDAQGHLVLFEATTENVQ